MRWIKHTAPPVSNNDSLQRAMLVLVGKEPDEEEDETTTRERRICLPGNRTVCLLVLQDR